VHAPSSSPRLRAALIAWLAIPLLLIGAASFLYASGALTGDRLTGGGLPSGSVQVAGSESMRPVVTACAEDFMSRNPQADIIVRGGGSGDGIAALLHGIVEIGMVSRELTQRERDFAASKNFETTVLTLALDGIAIIVNRANPIATLDLSQVHDIFTGKVRNWSELQGAEGEISPFARAPGSGTASLFKERVLGEGSYGASVQQLPANDAIVAQVAMRPGAIGYTDLGSLRSGGDRIKALALRTQQTEEALAPTPETIRSRKYPLTRVLNLATAGAPSGVAKAFLDYCLAANGQALTQRAGYVAAGPPR
jgi:phosphate transport system substrate-binding protein